MTTSALLNDVSAYYSGRLAEHGPTPRGVDWNSPQSQQVRFRELLRVYDCAAPGTLGDYGCGYGALLEHMREAGLHGDYCGYDIAEAMITAARQRHGHDVRAVFGCDEQVLAGADYVVASGVFNVRLQTPLRTWEAYVLDTIDRLNSLSTRGFAFNCLTSYSDPERMRPDLYYPDPCVLFDRCKRRYSRHVALLHDYGLWEFTILVRK